jgi:hypothetical protein
VAVVSVGTNRIRIKKMDDIWLAGEGLRTRGQAAAGLLEHRRKFLGKALKPLFADGHRRPTDAQIGNRTKEQDEDEQEQTDQQWQLPAYGEVSNRKGHPIGRC